MAGLFDYCTGRTAHHAPSEFHPTSSLCHRRRRIRTIYLMSMISFFRPLYHLHEQLVLAADAPTASRGDLVVGKYLFLERRVVASLMVLSLLVCCIEVAFWWKKREAAVLRWLFARRLYRLCPTSLTR